jgi:formylglycine-generating enzyme required for sulfatase activity
LEKEGYETVLAAASTWNVGRGADIVSAYELVRTLDEEGSAPPGMVRVQATETAAGRLEDYFIGRYEVTNREYKAFIYAGGYRNKEYWKHPFVKDGLQLTWEEAIREFVDQSDQPGPTTWLGGDYSPGHGEYPVSGVSWYEAAAYAEYAGKSLPTNAHWNVARGALTPMIRWPQLGGFAVLAPFSNFGGQGPVPVGSLQGFTAYGAFDMAGNVREWCWNETPQGRLIRGGAWNDNTYEFGNRRQAPPMDRSAMNGFRLAVYPDPETVPQAAFGFQRLGQPKDFRTQQPVSDAIFTVYREQFSYDETELNALIEHREESPGGWIREKISFDAAYGGEQVLAYLFLPSNTPPPYQTVIYFPGSGSAWMRSSQDLESYYEFSQFLSFLVRNGRAVLYPVYKGTFERGGRGRISCFYRIHDPISQGFQAKRRLPGDPSGHRQREARLLRHELGRVARSDHSGRGGTPRRQCRAGGGVWGRGRPEARDLNYVTRVMTPTLMLNGRYDNIYDIEEQIKPMFDLLGTPTEHKQLILYDTDHIPPRTEYIKEILAWLDHYLGPVK